MSLEEKTACRGRRSRDKVASGGNDTKTYRQLKHPYEPQKVFSDDEVQAIHDTALKVLEELGIKMLLEEARSIFQTAGARVHDDEMVFIGRDIIESALKTAPKSIRMRAANPEREQDYALGTMLFAPGAGCPNVTDLVRGRRPGDLESYEETLKLQQAFDVMHVLGPSSEPQDVPIQDRHYAQMRAQMIYCDKPMFAYSRGQAQVDQIFEMIQLGLNLSSDEFANGSWAFTIINTNSPRLIDRPMAQGVIDFARAKQMSIITPFCLSGAMAPITVAGALVLQHAEALACIALSQLTKEGAPVSYGGFASNVYMKSGAPAFGTPEHIKLEIGSGQLARLISLPWRSAAGSAGVANDMQSAGENHMGLWGALMANATVTVHAAGWLEGGLTFGYEKYINDMEALQTIAELCKKPETGFGGMAWEALAEVEPGGHFFGAAHTMERYQTAFYEPLVADLNNHGNWIEGGSVTSDQRATKVWQDTLANFQLPVNSGDIKERLAPYISTKKAEGGAAPLD